MPKKKLTRKPSDKKVNKLTKVARRILPAYGRVMPEPGGDPAWNAKCSSNDSMSVFWKKIRFIRRFVYTIQYLIPVTKVAFFTRDGVYSKEGRILVWGKFRRMFISFFPSYAHKLQTKYGLTGGCRSCGASCKLLIQCPHWDEKSHLCSIYEDRPPACRLFPITPADIRDRDIVLKKEPCGFAFQTPAIKPDRHITLRPERKNPKATKKPAPIPPKG